MTPRLIAFCSPAMGSGKSTAAERLEIHHGFQRVTFATALKRMAASLLESSGLSHVETYDFIYGHRKEEVVPVIGITSRRLQQLLGTEFGRKMIGESIWVDIAMAQARWLLNAGQSVVIDDMRFPNEYEAVIAAGGECLRIVRPGAALTSTHPSEGQLDLIHMREVWNTGDLAEFQDRIDALARG